MSLACIRKSTEHGENAQTNPKPNPNPDGRLWQSCPLNCHSTLKLMQIYHESIMSFIKYFNLNFAKHITDKRFTVHYMKCKNYRTANKVLDRLKYVANKASVLKIFHI